MTCLQIQQRIGPVKSAYHICPAQVSVHKASLQSRQIKPSCQTHKGNGALCQAIIYGAKVQVHGVKRVAEQCTHHALWVAQRPVKMLGELLTIRDPAADVKGIHLGKLHMRKPTRSPCAELLNLIS